MFCDVLYPGYPASRDNAEESQHACPDRTVPAMFSYRIRECDLSAFHLINLEVEVILDLRGGLELNR